MTIKARERRRILLGKTLLHAALLLSFLTISHSTLFLSNESKGDLLLQKAAASQELESSEPEGVTGERSKDAVAQATLDLVKYFEGYDPTCTDLLDGHATIGHGNLLHFGPCTAADNALYVTKEEAEATLWEDLLFFQDQVRQLVRVKISENMKSALTSFAYNVGHEGLGRSTLLQLLNAGDYRGAAGQFDLWINGPSGPLPGLIKRRAMEKELFLEGLHHLK